MRIVKCFLLVLVELRSVLLPVTMDVAAGQIPSSPGHAKDANWPPSEIEGGASSGMMHRYLMQQVDRAAECWRVDYENRKTREQIAAYQKQLRDKCLQAIGGLPERTALEAQVVGSVERPGYRVEKIIFQSHPPGAIRCRQTQQSTPGRVLHTCAHGISADRRGDRS